VEQVDAIQPRLRIPLKASADGTLAVPNLDLAPDGAGGGRLYVRGYVNQWSAWDHVLWWAPDAALGGLSLSLILMVMVWRRVGRRPRERGRLYCRGCNYELAMTGAREGSEAEHGSCPLGCPECGASPARGIIGRGRARRLIPAMAVLAAVAIGCGAVLRARLRPLILPPMAGVRGDSTWPLAAIDRIPWLPKYCKVAPDGRNGQRITAYDLATGRSLGEVATFWGLIDDRSGVMTPDGTRYVVALQRLGARKRGGASIAIVDLRTRAVRWYAIGDQNASVRIVRVSGDSARLYYQVQQVTGRSVSSAALWRMDLRGGAHELIEDLAIPLTQDQGGLATPTLFFCIAECAGGVKWAAVHDVPAAGGFAGSAGVALRVIGRGASGELVKLDIPAMGSSFYWPAMSGHGRTLYLPQPSGGGNAGGHLEVDLRTMTLRSPTPSGASLLGIRRPGFGVGASGIGSVWGTSAALISTDGARTWANLQTRGMGPRGPGICSAIAISGDLRAAAAAVGMTSVGAGGAARNSYEIEVWDLGDRLRGRGIDGEPDATGSGPAPTGGVGR
jgi:hypothetical protein